MRLQPITLFLALFFCAACMQTRLAGESRDSDSDFSADDTTPDDTTADDPSGADDGGGDEAAETFTWAKTFGTVYNDYMRFLDIAPDGGFIILGDTSTSTMEYEDVWLIKLDQRGEVEWHRSLNAGREEIMYWFTRTTDNGLILAGGSTSFAPGPHNGWAVRLDEAGGIVWQRAFGGEGQDHFLSIAPAGGDGFMIAGRTFSLGPNPGNIWLLRLDGGGSIVKEQALDVQNPDDASVSIVGASDGDFLVTGWCGGDLCVVRTDGEGQVRWVKTYGHSDTEEGRCIEETRDGGFIVAGGIRSEGNGARDVWVLKLDGNGDVLWQKAYGGRQFEGAMSIQETMDRGYCLAGYTSSFGMGWHDVWVLRLDEGGGILWQKTYGGEGTDEAFRIRQTPDRGFIIGARTDSFGAGGSDIWVLKLDAGGDIAAECPRGIGVDSDAIVTETSMVPVEQTAVVQAATSAVWDTDASAGEASAVIEMQCGR